MWRSRRWLYPRGNCCCRASHRWPMAFFFLRVDDSAMVNHGILILRIGRLARVRLILCHFELTKVANHNLQPTGIIEGIIFQFLRNFALFHSYVKCLTIVRCNELFNLMSLPTFSQKIGILTENRAIFIGIFEKKNGGKNALPQIPKEITFTNSCRK